MKLKSIRVQILAIVLVCYIVPTLLLGEYMGNVFLADLKKKTEQALASGAEHAYVMTAQHIERAIALSKDATYDGELSEAFSGFVSGSMSESAALRAVRSYLERKYGRETIFTFAVCFFTNQPDMLIYARSGFEQAQVYQEGAHARVKELARTLDTRCLFIGQGDAVYLVRNLYNLRMERFGTLVLGVQLTALLEPIADIERVWDMRADVLVGEAGASELNWQELPLGISTSEDSELITYTQYASQRDYALGIHMTLSKHRVYGEIEAFRRLMTWLFLLLIPMITFILWYVNRRIVRPITLLSQASRRIDAGELGVTVPMHGGDELGDLGVAFSNMSRRIADLIDKTYKEEIALRDAHISAMQSRINPHFLNNALESINWQARLEGSETISAMVESLSVLLNASMDRQDRRMVPLSEEAEVARAYFYFVGLRFGERLRVVCDIGEAVSDAMVPLLSIQPLLENAIEHGIAPAGGGEIRLCCARDGGKLRIEVTNSGRPMNELDRKRIDAALMGDNRDGNHLGLANISMRLHLIYTGKADITAFSDDENRTVIRIELPFERNGVGIKSASLDNEAHS